MDYLERLKLITKQKDILLAISVVGILMMMILPIPPIVMDIFLALSISISLLILMTSLYVEKPLDFSVFPSILLVLTLFRLSINIATTRLILIGGHTGPEAAGRIIESFGQFVVAGNYVVGVIVFLILVIINFIVITKGAGRIAEVAARFILDSMPGKQMAIDADLNAGLIKDKEAKQRRKEIEQESDFYGAMDGASKFVRGDAIAGLLIVAINIIAGFIIGVVQNDLAPGDAAATYTILTVGDGLVSQIPALITSTAAGILVTRSASAAKLGDNLFEQVLSHWRVLGMVGLFLLAFAFVPGMPTVTFILISVTLLALSWFSWRNIVKPEEKPGKEGEQATADSEEKAAEPSEQEKIEQMLPLDLLELEVGFGIIGLVDSRQGGELLNRITALRRQFATELGIIIPPIHIRDNLRLPANDYSIVLKGTEIARGTVYPNQLMAMDPGDAIGDIKGIDTVEPAFGLPAKWIDAEQKEQAEQLGYTIVDASTVMATHLSEVLKTHAADLIGRQELQHLLDIFAKQNPKIIEDLIPNLLTLGEVLKVVKNLLREQISIRDLRTILETLADMAGQTKNTEVLSEIVRHRMHKAITNKFRNPNNEIHAIMMDQSIEDTIRDSQQIMDDEIQAAIHPEQAKKILGSLENILKDAGAQAIQPVLLVAPEIRKATYNFIRRFLPDLPVVSHKEIDEQARIQLVGTVDA